MSNYITIFIGSAKRIFDSLPDVDNLKVNAAIIRIRERNFKAVEIKTLKSPIRELKIGKYRFIFFIQREEVYFVHAFIKKTAKTPKKEIEYARKIYKNITQN